MENNNILIHLECMDLAGKTTIAEKIKEIIGSNCHVNNNSLSGDNIIQTFANELGELNLYDDEIYGYLYYVALLADIKKYNPGGIVVQDSTLLLRSINYHMGEGNEELVELFKGLIPRHPVPNVSIYLTASIESRIRRLAKRISENPHDISKNDSLILTNPSKFIEMDNNLKELSVKCFNSYVIDNTGLTEEEVLKEILTICDQYIKENWRETKYEKSSK